MALGESRQVFQTNVELSVSGVAERGAIVSYDPVQAGNGILANAAAVSGLLVQPAGLLLDDVEALNYFEHPQYRQRNVVAQGEVIGLLTEGEVVTDFVETTLDGQSVGTYAAGDPLYLADNGQLSRNAGDANRVRVGTALGTVDADGFLKVRIDL